MTRAEAEQAFEDAKKDAGKPFSSFRGDPWECGNCSGEGIFICGNRGKPMDSYHEEECESCNGTGLNEDWDIDSEEWEEEESEEESEEEIENEEVSNG